MSVEPEVIAGGSEESVDGFRNAMSAFMEDPVSEPEAQAPPKPVVEGEVATPEPAPEEEPQADVPKPPKTEPEKLEDEFIEFTGKQKERFNSVYGALKRLERENAELQRRVSQPAPAVPSIPTPTVPAAQAVSFAEPKPKRDDFQGDDTAWVEAVGDWSARKAEHAATVRAQQEFARAQATQAQQAQQVEVERYLQKKTAEGYQKHGQYAFDNACSEVVAFAPFGSSMNQTLFSLDGYADVVVELSKNLAEADRISRLSPNHQVYELMSLERRLQTKTELAQKTLKPNTPKVEAPGSGGEDKAPQADLKKLKKAALASGRLRDIAKIFEADDTL